MVPHPDEGDHVEGAVGGAITAAAEAIVATPEGVLVGSGGETAEIVPEAADHIFVRRL